MNYFLTYIFRQFLFWMLVFFTQQVLFLIINFSAVPLSFIDLAINFKKSFAMNIASSTYLTIIPLLLCLVSLFKPIPSFIHSFTPKYTFFLLLICTFIAGVDAGLYKMWGTKITSRALAYMAYPKDLLPTLFTLENLGLMLMIIAEIITLNWLRNKITIRFVQPVLPIKIKILLLFVLLSASFIGARGGTNNVPLNRNWVFYAKQSILNYAALNGFWNLADLLNKPFDTGNNPYLYFSTQQAQQIVESMHPLVSDSTEYILNTLRPNIVLVFLESWSADVIETLGGEKGVAPKFSELAADGFLFSNSYATGFRTEQGMLAILSAFPAQPISSIIKEFGKFDKLPNLYTELQQQGYHTSFYSGGSIEFDNIEGYLRSAGVQQMVGEKQWNYTKYTHWGAYDEETFSMHLKAIKNLPSPFFTGVTTMSTHEAFEATVPIYFNADKDKTNDAYRNSMHYADSCLFKYIEAAKKEDWYAKTLFIIVADHGCRFPKMRNNYDTQRHKIPLLFMGGALKKEYKGKRHVQTTSHLDIAHTILAQMNLDATIFKRSKNVLNRNEPAFAYYTFDNGFGIITDTKTVIYDHIQQKDLLEHSASDSLATKLESWGKAYLQTNYQENIEFAESKAH
jgi:phosphoglycerol transferase MdoB-like AlkP superfamily enzyme